MRRYQLVLGGTAAGIAAVLAFPTHSATHLTIPSASSSDTTTGGSTTISPSTSGGAPTPTSTAGSARSSTPKGTAGGTRTTTSDDQQFQYGDLAVKVTVSGSKITNVTVTTINETDGRSASIDSYAIPQLEQQVIAAGSVHVDGVSGATFTSQAFVDAVANALQKLGISS
jgi:uncharacterized protein with FMN-binding domain